MTEAKNFKKTAWGHENHGSIQNENSIASLTFIN